ncbi:unnamed protein product [Clonostachys solani]|uniref:Uncharacterized protein n=1 Tax=Clonostachys solani TaxID=160281 RepID=A0A9N9Z191_9HYPO|nr:unnamed protein product [Clonostachys solani]
MVAPSLLGPLGIVLATALPALAFDRISIASTVKADTEVEVTIRNDLDDGTKSFDGGFTNFNVYLATTPPGWGTGPVCLLANGTKIDTTSVKVTIPADVVPSDAKLKITTMEWNSDPKKDGPSGFQYSNTFSLQGGTGAWGKSELAGRGFSDMDTVPCSAYSCIRKCNDDGFDEMTKLGDSEDIEAYKAVYKPIYECMTKCPGTTMPSWDTLIKADEDTESSSSTASSSKTKTASSSSTSTGTATATATDSSDTASSTLSTAVTTPTGSSTQSATSPTTTDSGATRVFGTAASLVLAAVVATCHML